MHRSLKKRLPFRMATTSFIYPAGYAANVKQLAPWVDEIELLLFQSDQLPTKAEVRELCSLSETLDISYNVHLPMDISLGARDTGRRNASIDTICRTIDLVAPLAASTHTLHLTYEASNTCDARVRAWQDRCIRSLKDLLQKTKILPGSISVETLDFNPQWLARIVDQLDLSVCIDIGHLIRYGFGVEETLALFLPRITIYHLHGVTDGKDHTSLASLDTTTRNLLVRTLEGFQGSVSLEVFNHQHFTDSVESLAQMLSHAMTPFRSEGGNG